MCHRGQNHDKGEETIRKKNDIIRARIRYELNEESRMNIDEARDLEMLENRQGKL